MALKIKVEIVELGSGTYVALFRGIVEGTDIDPNKLPMVSLSRIPGKCHFRLDQMHMHDHHAPPWQDTILMNSYIQRVLEDIRHACVKSGIAMGKEIQKIDSPKIFKGNPALN